MVNAVQSPTAVAGGPLQVAGPDMLVGLDVSEVSGTDMSDLIALGQSTQVDL